MQTTEHFNLKKPSQNDFINIDDLNQNTDKIDAILFDKIGKKELLPLTQGLDGKLDKSGGEIEGNLSVANNLEVQGSIKWSEKVHLQMKGDDKLVATAPVAIFSDTIAVETLDTKKAMVTHLQVNGNVTLPRYRKKTATISTSGWSSVSGEYPHRYQLNIEGLEATDYVSIDIQRSSLKAAEDAELCPTVEENNGYVYIYAKKVPTSSIAITYKVEV